MLTTITFHFFQAIYGLTEVSAGAFLSMEEENEDAVSTTVGHVMDHLEVKVNIYIALSHIQTI